MGPRGASQKRQAFLERDDVALLHGPASSNGETARGIPRIPGGGLQAWPLTSEMQQSQQSRGISRHSGALVEGRGPSPILGAGLRGSRGSELAYLFRSLIKFSPPPPPSPPPG